MSGVGHSTSVGYSTSVSASRSSDSPVFPSSTRFPSSSLSSSTSNFVATFNTFSRLLSTSRSAQTTTSSASSSSTSSVGHVDSSSVSSSVTPTASATTPFAKEPPPAESTSTGVPTSTSTPTPVSSTVSGTTTGTESVSTPPHLVTKSPNSPQIVSASIPTNIQTTQPGSTFLATITPWSLVPIPTRSNGSPNSSSTSNSLLLLILGPVLGVLIILVLGMIIFRCRARRRAENMTNVRSSGSETSREQKHRMMIEETPRVNVVTVGQRITSHRGSSTYTPEHIITLSHADKSSQNSNGQSSDPFVDRSETVPSRTSLHAASTHSVDSVSTNVAFTVPVNAVARDVGKCSIDASTSSLGLHFVAPLTTDDSSTRSPHLSPSWHYAPTSSSGKRERWNEEQQGESLQAPASPKPFPLGMGNARLRLHALLEEARKI